MKPKQIIYYGVPGTGKSYEVDEYLKKNKVPEKNIFRVTFHPEYSYSDFIGHVLPVSKDDDITYSFQKGVLTQALEQAYKDTSIKVYLVIEEMNRGNVAAIFGDIFQLLDRDENNYSRYPVRNSIITENIPQIEGNTNLLSLPPNFNIIGTINTSDQNLFIMDNAFKRRFSWKYITTQPVMDTSGNIDDNFKFQFSIPWGNKTRKFEWTEFYMKINSYITNRELGLGLTEDKQIGQFFIDYNIRTTEQEFLEHFHEKLLQYLWHDVHVNSFGHNRLFDLEIYNFSDLHLKFKNNLNIFSKEFIEYYEQ